MARKIRRKEHWVYLDDEEREVPDPADPKKKIRKMVGVVKPIEKGERPPGGGSVFMVLPPPMRLLIELGLARSAIANRHDKPSVVVANILRESIGGWQWVEDAAGNELAFEGPSSVDQLETEDQGLLLEYITDRANKRSVDPADGSAAGNGSTHSEDSPSDRPASGAATAV